MKYFILLFLLTAFITSSSLSFAVNNNGFREAHFTKIHNDEDNNKNESQDTYQKKEEPTNRIGGRTIPPNEVKPEGKN